MTSLDAIHSAFAARLGGIGRVVIAGGAVRDTLMGVTPKDYDVFVLGSVGVPADMFSSALDGLQPLTLLEFHNSEPFLQGTYKFGAAVVQVMATPHRSVADLLDSFDWNVSRFAFDGASTIDLCPVSEIGTGKTLSLHRVTFPASTLRRGFRFSERFKMLLNRDDLTRLCAAVLDSDAKIVDAADVA